MRTDNFRRRTPNWFWDIGTLMGISLLPTTAPLEGAEVRGVLRQFYGFSCPKQPGNTCHLAGDTGQSTLYSYRLWDSERLGFKS